MVKVAGQTSSRLPAASVVAAAAATHCARGAASDIAEHPVLLLGKIKLLQSSTRLPQQHEQPEVLHLALPAAPRTIWGFGAHDSPVSPLLKKAFPEKLNS